VEDEINLSTPIPEHFFHRPRQPGQVANVLGTVRSTASACLLLTVCAWLVGACKGTQVDTRSGSPSVEFTSVPWAGADNPSKLSTIKGRAHGVRPGQHIVLYARGQTTWWVQPFANRPLTTIQPDSKWQNSTHPGAEYAALLVEPGFQPPMTTEVLPTQGVVAYAVVHGAPAPWQRWWFSPLCLILAAFAVFGFYRLQLYQETQRLNLRFEERLGERTRVAQELHDTLLQGVISASMQLHIVADQLPPDAAAKPALDRVLELMGRVVEEGRNAVGGLRSPHRSSVDLERAFSQIQQEFTGQDEVAFRVIVEGTPCPLHQVIRDEIYGIGREALTNAFRHSQAKSVEVEMEYASTGLRVLVRDSGVGFDPKVLQFGRDGHWGLSGMRERAKRIGARLRVLSRPAAGTEVELAVPSHIAFVSQPRRSVSNWISKLLPKGKRSIVDSPREHNQ